MNYFLYKLSFTSPVHFGLSDSALSLYTSGESFRGDRLFSALCHSALSLGGEKRLENWIADNKHRKFRTRRLLQFPGNWIGEST